jgi:hypothetical protein
MAQADLVSASTPRVGGPRLARRPSRLRKAHGLTGAEAVERSLLNGGSCAATLMGQRSELSSGVRWRQAFSERRACDKHY